MKQKIETYLNKDHIPAQHLQEIIDFLSKQKTPEMDNLCNEVSLKLYNTITQALSSSPINEKKNYQWLWWEQLDLLYRKDWMPLEYVTKQYNDWIHLEITTETMIPRLKTNINDYVVNFMSECWNREYNVVDLWTGTGVIWLSLFRKKPDQVSSLQLVDNNDSLHKIVENNISNSSIDKATIKDIRFVKSDLLHDVDMSKNWDYILIANLPYSSEADLDTFNEFVKKEPRSAFFWGGMDGLDTYKRLFEAITDNTNHINKFSLIVLECSSKNIYWLHQWLLNKSSLSDVYNISIQKDRFWRDRNIQLKKKIHT